MFTEQLRGRLDAMVAEGSPFAPMLLALYYLENGDLKEAEKLLENADENLKLSIWYDWVKGRIELEKENYLSAEVYIKKVLIRNALFYGAYEKILHIFKAGNRKKRAEDLLMFIDRSLTAFPHKEALKPYRDWLGMSTGGEVEIIDGSDSTDTIDSIIRDVEEGKITDEIEPEEKAEEFGAALSDIFEGEKEPAGTTEPEKATPAAARQTPGDKNKQGPGGRKIISKTLGEIYASQGQIDKAIEIFEELVKQNPDDAALSRKLEHLRTLLNDTR